MIPELLISVWFAAGQVRTVGLQLPPTEPSLCDQARAAGMSAATTELCLGDEEFRAGEEAPKIDSRRSGWLRAAADHYRKGANLTSDLALKARVMDALARVFDSEHLQQPAEEESALRELIGLRPTELDPLFRLARLQENWGQIERAEDTLIGTRRLNAEALEPYKMLAQFYVRRLASLQPPVSKPPADPGSAPQPDEKGVFAVGSGIKQPSRMDVPQYPADAQAAGIAGAVVLEVVISEQGFVTDVHVVRSIPTLDAAAIKAVQNWRYEPTLVNGKAVPVRMTATVNFTNR